jgi:1,4-alpha-glucan branching enzyme
MQKKPDKTKGETMKKTTSSKSKRVGFQMTAEPGSEVFVAGSFNDWNPKKHRLKDNPGSGHCKTTIVLPAGRHEYKFVVNGEWRNDPNCPDSMASESGAVNSVVTVQ